MQPILTARGIDRVFNAGGMRVQALTDVNVDIIPGRLTILKGRSGSGKTCMINLLGALDRPTAGSIDFMGTEITNKSENRRDTIRRTQMGFVFQAVALISNMSAYENVEFALRLSGYDRAKRRARAMECLDQVGLAQRMQHRPAELSGGEQQRVAIARAFCHKPSIVFADEPTAELDTMMSLSIMKLFRSLIQQSGATIVMTTHDPNMMELADDVYTLVDGAITEHQHITPMDGAKPGASAAQEDDHAQDKAGEAAV